VVAAINTLLSLQQRASTTTAAAAAGGTTDAQSAPQVVTEEMLKALLARISELAHPMMLAALQAMLSGSSVSSDSTVGSSTAAVTGALAQGLVASDWRSLPAESVAAAVNTLLSLQQQSAATSSTAAGPVALPEAQTEEIQKALLARCGELTATVLLASLQAVLSSSSSSSGSTSTTAAAAVVGALVNKLVASDWRSLSLG
jgi:hypothetical protein